MQQYFDSLNSISSELVQIDTILNSFISSEQNDFTKYFLNIAFKNSKKIRSVITILTLKAIFNNVSPLQLKICALVELLHNASLIHDDIIDNSDIRRNQPSCKKLFGSQKAVLAGDFLLAVALKELAGINNRLITEYFAQSLINICNGEINQLNLTSNIPPLENYILKSEQKTAELFKIALKASFLIQNENQYLDFAENFGKNFGIAFQIRNDINDIFLQKKSFSNDLKNGILTAPAIFYLQTKSMENIQNLQLKNLKNDDILQKSNDLCNLYMKKALDLLANFSDNQYKQILIDTCNVFGKGQNYEH